VTIRLSISARLSKLNKMTVLHIHIPKKRGILRFAANRELGDKISKFKSLKSSEITGRWFPNSGAVKRMAKPLVDRPNLRFVVISLSLP
jgi:hypothetical protein